MARKARGSLQEPAAGQPWRCRRQLFVQAVGRPGPLEVETGTPVTVLGMGRVETDRHAERHARRGGLDKTNGLIATQERLVAQAAIGLLLEIRVAANQLLGIEQFLRTAGKRHAELAGKSCPVARLPQQCRVAARRVPHGNRRRPKIEAVRPLREARQQR